MAVVTFVPGPAFPVETPELLESMYIEVDLSKLFKDFWNIKPRGPDNSYLENYGDVWVGFHRLAIMDTSFKSNQPFVFQEVYVFERCLLHSTLL